MYRINAKPPEPTFTWWERNRYLVIDAIKLVVMMLMIVTVNGVFLALLAAGIQFVVNGFSGHPVGTFAHYFVALFIIWGFRINKRN